MAKIIDNISFDALGYMFDFELRPRATIISGDTGSGKSFFCHCLKEASNDPENRGRFSNFVLFEHNLEDIESIRQKKDKVIIIDNADRLLADNAGLIEHIATDYDNQYIIIGRRLYDIDVSPNHHATVKEKDGKFTLDYKWNVPGWY